MRALRFQTGGRHQTSPASLRGLVHGVRVLPLLKYLPVYVSNGKETNISVEVNNAENRLEFPAEEND